MIGELGGRGGGEDMMVLGVNRLNICTFLSEVEIWSDSS